MRYFSTITDDPIQDIKGIYNRKRGEIELRLNEFKEIWETGTKEEFFVELVFCILTPMARGKYCSIAVSNMLRTGVLFTGDSSEIARELTGARFIYKKSAYIVEAREKLLRDSTTSLKSIISRMDDGHKAREWMVQNVKGIGYKEASHFLRNIGFAQNLAILDRHILKSLHSIGVIEEIPGSLSRSRYLDIEKRMIEFSEAVRIPMSYLDLVLWYKETGEIFK
jgi:N-glycosylase/DNA lyase